MLELDHIFVCVPNERKLNNSLANSGLNLSARRVHHGQGTANRCAFFDNAYLEFLLCDRDEDLQSESVQFVSLWERMQWRNTKASPFGIAFRFVKSNKQDFPVETRPYYAPFLPNGASIPVATPSNATQEPLVFLSLVTKKPIEKFTPNSSTLKHRGSRRILTKLEITSPYTKSKQLQWFCQQKLISIAKGESHQAELELNNGREEQSFDFEPIIPLSIRW